MDLRQTIARTIAPESFQESVKLRETVQRLAGDLDLVRESFSYLAQTAREDVGWHQIATSGYEQFFSRSFLNELIRNARFAFLKNPVIRRGVEVQKYYVFGRGVEMRVDRDESRNQLLQEFLKLNRDELGIIGLGQKEETRQHTGNLFLVLFSDHTSGMVRVRELEALEITDMISNPEDGREVWFYKREWNAQVRDPLTGAASAKPMARWYPALGYDPPERTPVIQGASVAWDAPVLHVKTGAFACSQYGLPEFFAAIDWARAYKDFLEAWASIQQALKRFGFDIETKGGQKAVDAMQSSIQTNYGASNLRETNPTQSGSAFIHGPGGKISSIKTAGATTGPEEARRLFLMAAMVFGLPETFFSDASVGSLATAHSLDRPTELKFQFVQQQWVETLTRICEYVLDIGHAAPRNADVRSEAQDWKLVVKFPPIRIDEASGAIDALTQAATLGSQQLAGTIDPRTFVAAALSILGIDNADQIIDAMFPEETYDPLDWSMRTPEERAEMAATMAHPEPDPKAKAAESLAIAELARTAQQLHEAIRSDIEN